MKASEHLTPWTQPKDYGGFSPVGDYVVLTKHRDSDLLDRVNWDCAVESLKAEAYDVGEYGYLSDDRPVAYHWRAGHWAVGWVEYLMVRADAPEALLERAGEIVCILADYPILNEERYSEQEYMLTCEYWAQCSVAERVDYLRDAGLSIFAARRDSLPEDDRGDLYQTLREWACE